MALILRVLLAGIGGVGLALGLSSLAASQNAAIAQHDAPSPQQSAAATKTIADFLANPGALLEHYPFGGGSIVSTVRDLVMADPSTLNAVLSLIPKANLDQKNAIGNGLGLAALELARRDLKDATTVQQAIVRLDDPIVLAAYAAVTGDQNLAAAGPGGGGGGSPGGGGESETDPPTATGGAADTPSFSLNTAVDNIPDTYTIPTITAASPGSSTTTSTPSDPVSSSIQ